MRAYVFTDQALGRYAGQFVWLAVDTENAANAAFLKKFPIPALPTLLVLDPKKESVTMRYVGGATVPQLTKLLDDAQRLRKSSARSTSSTADAALEHADILANAGKNTEAAAEYERALKAAPANWKSLGRAAESLLFALQMAHQPERCATMAADLYDRVKATSSGPNVAAGGLGCTLDVPATYPQRASLIATFEKETKAALDNPKLDLSGDDRSGLYQVLIATREDAKDEAGARTLREQWSAFLDQAAASAKTKEQRAVYDPHRLSAYIELHTPEKAVPMLEQSEKDFPNDYNPPARLAIAYKEMKRYDDALAASDRALKKVYGPRKIGLLRTRADIYEAKGDKEAAKRTLRDAISSAEALPEGQRNDRTIAMLKQRVEKM